MRREIGDGVIFSSPDVLIVDGLMRDGGQLLEECNEGRSAGGVIRPEKPSCGDQSAS